MKHSHFSREHSQDAATNSPYKGSAREFDGDVTLQRLVTPDESREIELLAVWFSAGARTRPHIHDVDQVLHIVEGQGIVTDDNERLLVNAGDVVTVPAHVWHWHGAAPDFPMMHISIRKAGSTTNWQVDEKDWETSYREMKSKD